MAMICSSVNFDRFMVRSSHWAGLYHQMEGKPGVTADSDLAEAVMLQFAAMGYACLPVHDSFIVHHALQEDLHDIMQAAFKAAFGTTIDAAADAGIGEVVDSSLMAIEADLDELLQPVGHQARLEAFRSRQRSS
jgi:hypothetical protein